MARTTRGRLYKRGKKGYYYLQFYINGKEHREALRDENGDPITKIETARIAADRILAPLRFKDEAQKRRTLVNELATLEQKAEAAAADLKNQTATLVDGWKIYLDSPSCPENLKKYGMKPPSNTRAYIAKMYYRMFLDWMQDNHPEIRLLSEVSEKTAYEYMAFLKKKHGDSGYVINIKIQIIKRLYAALLDDEKITMKMNPFKRIKSVKIMHVTKEALSVEEVRRLIDTAEDPEMRLLVIIGFCTGLRRGDCCTLQWDEIDLDHRIISRIPNKMRNRTQDPENVRVRIGIPHVLLDELSAIPPSKRRGPVLPNICNIYNKNRPRLDSCLESLFKNAKIETVKPGSKSAQHPHGIVIKGFHSLRHTFVSLSAEAGAPQHVIQRIVGHSSPLMTMHYTHLGNADLLRSADRLPVLPVDGASDESPGDVIAPIGSSSAEPDESERDRAELRAELRALSETLPSDRIREILNNYGEF